MAVSTHLPKLLRVIGRLVALHQSRNFSRNAISILKKHIIGFVTETTIMKNQEMLGSHYAGKAINISKTTAAHAGSYSFTSSYIPRMLLTPYPLSFPSMPKRLIIPQFCNAGINQPFRLCDAESYELELRIFEKFKY